MNLEKESLVCQADENINSRASTVSMSSISSAESTYIVADSHYTCSTKSTKSISDDTFKTIRTVIANNVTTNTRTKKKRVRFGSLEVHEHAVKLGGPGVPGSGPSITLEWKEQSYFLVHSVEVFENSRPFLNRRGSELLQTKSQRISMLLDAGHTMKEINICRQENDMIRKQRLKSIKKYYRFQLLSDVFRL